MAPLLSVDTLSKTYRGQGQVKHAVSDISFTLSQGETLGLAGPSGCGKSTLARLIMRLVEPDAGTISFRGENWMALHSRHLRQARRHMQMVFQDSHAAFNPRSTVAAVIAEPLRIHSLFAGKALVHEVERLLDRVGLPAGLSTRPILDLSGGQRQRVAIARALATRPSLLVLDEAVSALDVSVRAQILSMLVSIQQETGLSCLFVSHDIAVIRAVCHRVAIMEAGRMVEYGDTQQVISAPQSEMAQRLIEAVPAFQIDKENHNA